MTDKDKNKETNETEIEKVDDAHVEVEDTKKEEDEYEKVCFICHRPESTAGKMIELPNNISVCSDCMQKSFDAMSNGQIDYSQLMNMPGVQVFNMSDMEQQDVPKQQKLKKKKEGGEKKPLIDIREIPAPHKIKASLDEYVVGQEYAKKVMSVAVYNHYKRVATDTMDDIEIEKSNMLMIGPTGSGKTYLVKTLARLLDVPLAITDATSLTEAGYIGDDIESVVSKLLAAAENDVEKAEQGIIFIDEIDKIAKKKNTSQRDVSGESVQQGMLKLLEGSDVEVPVGANSKNAMVPLTTVNTRNILFICGGAFPDLDGIIKERLSKQSSIGFGADLKDKYDHDKTILEKVTIEDLRNFGMIPEFIGRLPIIFTLRGLDEDMLVKILKEPKNAILKQYQKLLALDEVKLDFDEGALSAIARKAMEKDTGARALRAIIEEFMLDIMYEIPKDDNIGEVTITKEYIEGTGGPVIMLRGQEVARLR
ncbi:ATP-dependent Clp protease ATP-binding subunit ClpX [Dorea sp. D27]|uniref:ATP-dependent Clp protease ATP-binding subunit ClpX n=1 Tax=Dorea sp. D27 TaxID=658665 RepID=UPI000673A383|nr:ATP-dependent Clp protease ATP-binding subunit ClpX [Dorea sp. D27]KMZ55895.1 ATP-dependent Clp protease, ATP-binding subunit ClpX [Dorea sp. D27]